MRTLILILILYYCQDSYAWVYVSSSLGFGVCTYTSIQDALDSDDSEIRLLNNQDFIASPMVNQYVFIKAGYSSCLNAQLNAKPTENSVLKSTAVICLAALTLKAISSVSIRLNNYYYLSVISKATDISALSGIDETHINDIILAITLNRRTP